MRNQQLRYVCENLSQALLLPRIRKCHHFPQVPQRSGLSEFAKAHIEGDHLAVYWVYKFENDAPSR
jgi:hypothetical protein